MRQQHKNVFFLSDLKTKQTNLNQNFNIYSKSSSEFNLFSFFVCVIRKKIKKIKKTLKIVLKRNKNK